MILLGWGSDWSPRREGVGMLGWGEWKEKLRNCKVENLKLKKRFEKEEVNLSLLIYEVTLERGNILFYNHFSVLLCFYIS